MAVSSPASDPLRGFDPKGTYDAAALDYEQGSRAFWEQLSTRTVDRMALQSGESVLDVPCGTGPSLVRAARNVGAEGRVLGVDYAEQMLAIARDKVAAEGHTNVELRTGDMTDLDLAPGSFDAVICVLGLFFVDDMSALVRSFWELVAPQGRLAITVLGDEFFTPMLDVFIHAVHAERPGFDVVEPWRRTADVDTLRSIMAEGGVPDVEIHSDVDVIPVQPDDWWRIVMGTGLRRTASALEEAEAAGVRRRCEDFMRQQAIREVTLTSHGVVATRA
ncbi:MAG: class I SAM-dependent methyltransferase [Acidimicrobiia bacterium]|nr:class I SAM-dependent methyltransferase [Acidimicrobiia bacterium]